MGPGVVSAALNGPSQIAVGDAPSVSMAPVPGKGIVAIETHQNGFCQNNEPQNKAPRPAMCEQTPRPTPGVLVYSYGALGEWAALLAAKQPMNACHEHLMHVSTTTTICLPRRLGESLSTMKVHSPRPILTKSHDCRSWAYDHLRC